MTIYKLSYRIDKGPQQHIYALMKICEKRKKILQKEYGERVKFSRITRP